jgi:hypothetical protein
VAHHSHRKRRTTQMKQTNQLASLKKMDLGPVSQDRRQRILLKRMMTGRMQKVPLAKVATSTEQQTVTITPPLSDQQTVSLSYTSNQTPPLEGDIRAQIAANLPNPFNDQQSQED